MTPDRIPNGESVLVDANILVYAIQKQSRQCEVFLQRCAMEQITGVLPSHILAEVMHILMITEARDNGWITGSNPAKQLAKQPGRIKAVVRYENFIRDILSVGLRFTTLIQEDFLTAMSIQKHSGLLTNDALLAAVGQRLRVKNIASADEAFRKAHGFTTFAPNDLV